MTQYVWPRDYDETTRRWIFDHRAEGHLINECRPRRSELLLSCTCGAQHTGMKQ